MTSPQPPGHLKQAHFFTPPLSTRASLSSVIVGWSGKADARSVRKSKRSKCRRRRTRETTCFMSAHYVQKWLHICSAKRFGLVTTRAVGSRFDQRPAFVSRVKPPNAGRQHPGFSGESSHPRQPLIDRHGCCLGRKGHNCRRWIAFAQNVRFVLQPLIGVMIIPSQRFVACAARIDIAPQSKHAWPGTSVETRAKRSYALFDRRSMARPKS